MQNYVVCFFLCNFAFLFYETLTMKHLFYALVIVLTFFTACSGREKNETVDAEHSEIVQIIQGCMDAYPQSQLCDVYKFCFQDWFGPEHLVSDSASVADYIVAEIERADSADWQYPLFAYPVGMYSNFVRVDLNYVRQGVIPAGVLASAFVESAQGWHEISDESISQWSRKWNEILSCIRSVEPLPLNFEEDSVLIANALSEGQYAFHHSRLFNATYHQHYRIIRRDVYDSVIVPLIENK